LLAVVSYPASLSHIFRGYRGTGAVGEFLDAANTGDRLSFFAGLVNEYLFDGYLWLWLLAIAVMTGIIMINGGKIKGRADGLERHVEIAPYFLLLFASLGYFFTVSKTALLLYETSNRYQLPIYGILLLLVMAGFYELWNRILFSYIRIDGKKKEKYRGLGLILLMLIFLLEDVHGLVSGKVIFLYEEDEAHVEYARQNEKEPVIVLYNDATPYHVWWCSQELMQYEKIYFASEGNPEKITDDVICGSDRLIVYAADSEMQKDCLAMILESNPKLGGYELVMQRGLWSVFEFE